jgi:D-alanine-D-alanine ligase
VKNPRSMVEKRAILAPEYLETDREFLELGSRPMRVAYLYNADPGADAPASLPDEAPPHGGTYAFVATETAALRSLGHEVIELGITYQNLHTLRSLNADFVFNGCEGNGVDSTPGVEVILALEKRPLPFSGVGSGPYHLTCDKFKMKQVLAAAGVPVPVGTALSHPEAALSPRLRYPLFVKPRYGFASEGISANSRVTDEAACRTAVENLTQLTGLDAVVEEFIPGREITVGVIGNSLEMVVLPPLEVRFGKAYRGKPRIRMHDTKDNPSSPLYWGFHTECPAGLPPETERRVMETAQEAYRAVGGDGFGRVDIRLAKDGTPYVLEVNGNCSLEEALDEHDAGMMPLMARALGWSYAELLARLIGAGLRRPIKRYRSPKLLLRREGSDISAHSALNLKKGVRVAPVGTISRALCQFQVASPLFSSCGSPLHVEPHLRYLSHAEQPNLAVENHSGGLWLVTTRTIKSGEELTLDRDMRFELNHAQDYSADEAPVRVRRGIRRRS